MRKRVNPTRRRLLALLGVAGAGGLTWDVVRTAGNVDITGPDKRPATSDEDVDAYVRGCTAFGLDLLAELVDVDPDRNLLLSPLGLSGVLAMTWAGARGETQQRMRETLHFPHGQDRLHPAVGALQYDLDQRGAGVQHRNVPQVWNVNRFELRLANALWGQTDYPFRESFLETLEHNYGSDLRTANFSTSPDAARQRINRWGSQASGGLVTDLLPPDSITRYTKFVLTNAVYLRADWHRPFDPDDTEPGEFTRPDGSTVEVPMMDQKDEFPFLWARPDEEAQEDIGYRAVELPYVGEAVSMVLFVPEGEGSLEDLERMVDAAWLEERFADLDEQGGGEVNVRMPRFTFRNDFDLVAPLESIGMTTAFDAERANFEGMTDPPEAADGLRLAHVFHDTYVAVDEEGTVAVAVSASIGEQVSGSPSIILDRPFLFCIRDRETDAVLFLGRVVDPSGN